MAEFLIDKGTKNLVEGLSKDGFAPGNIVPIEHGGTGANNPGDARVNLGLSLAGMNIIWENPTISSEPMEPYNNGSVYTGVDTSDYNLFTLVYNIGKYRSGITGQLPNHMGSVTFVCRYGETGNGMNQALVTAEYFSISSSEMVAYRRGFKFMHNYPEVGAILQFSQYTGYTAFTSGGGSVNVEFFDGTSEPSFGDTNYLDLVPLYLIAGNV